VHYPRTILAVRAAAILMLGYGLPHAARLAAHTIAGPEMRDSAALVPAAVLLMGERFAVGLWNQVGPHTIDDLVIAAIGLVVLLAGPRWICRVLRRLERL
jgi:hypothetical protein